MSTCRSPASAVNTKWAEANREAAAKIVGVYNRSIAWLYTPGNRAEAVTILNKVSKLKTEDVEQGLRLPDRRQVLRAERQGVEKV